MGTHRQLGCFVPSVYVTLRKQRLQLQWGHERWYGDGSPIGIETEFFCQTMLEEFLQVERIKVGQGELILILYIHILHERSMEVKHIGRSSVSKGGVVEGKQLAGL